MQFVLSINLGNDAFDPPNRGREIARILREVANDVGDGIPNGVGNGEILRDTNGNRVGSWSIKDKAN